jgi:beta-glucosidase
LYPFGYGLTYGSVELSDLELLTASADQGAKLSVNITNKSDVAIEEVVQCYIKDNESALAVRNHNLCAFKRVALAAGESKTIELEIEPMAFTVVDDDGKRIVDSSSFRLFVGVSQPDDRSVELTGVKPLQADIKLS